MGFGASSKTLYWIRLLKGQNTLTFRLNANHIAIVLDRRTFIGTNEVRDKVFD